jgi:hypothetical protein
MMIPMTINAEKAFGTPNTRRCQPFEIGETHAEVKAGGSVAGVEPRHAAIDQQPAKRYDERLDLKPGDQKSMRQSNDAAEENHQGKRQRPRHARLVMKSTNKTPNKAISEPRESSMPPVMMTTASPMPRMPNRPTGLAVLAIFIGSRKRGLMIAKTAPTTMIRIRSPASFLSTYRLSSGLELR